MRSGGLVGPALLLVTTGNAGGFVFESRNGYITAVLQRQAIPAALYPANSAFPLVKQGYRRFLLPGAANRNAALLYQKDLPKKQYSKQERGYGGEGAKCQLLCRVAF